jgi:hypothetical protein
MGWIMARGLSAIATRPSSWAGLALVPALGLAVACNASGRGREVDDAARGPDSAGPADRAAAGGEPGVATRAADSAPSPAATIDCRSPGDGKTTLVFVNRCPSPVTFAGSDITGGTLASGAFQCVDVGDATQAISGKRYWGWVGADPGAERHSLAEFTFNTSFQDFDWYDISFVDAFNLPMQIVPVGHADCKTLTCAVDFLAGCPVAGQYRDATGNLVACVSPNRDDPQSPVVQYFEACDDAYAWSGDDANGTDPSPMRACAGEDYDIVFCPEAL